MARDRATAARSGAASSQASSGTTSPGLWLFSRPSPRRNAAAERSSWVRSQSTCRFPASERTARPQSSPLGSSTIVTGSGPAAEPASMVTSSTGAAGNDAPGSRAWSHVHPALASARTAQRALVKLDGWGVGTVLGKCPTIVARFAKCTSTPSALSAGALGKASQKPSPGYMLACFRKRSLARTGTKRRRPTHVVAENVASTGALRFARWRNRRHLDS